MYDKDFKLLIIDYELIFALKLKLISIRETYNHQ
jgi:hypothetical protein